MPWKTKPVTTRKRTKSDFFSITGSVIASFSFIARTRSLSSGRTFSFLPNISFRTIRKATMTMMIAGVKW